MVRLGPTQQKILTALRDGSPRSLRQIVEETGLTDKAVSSALYRLYNREIVLRTEEPLMETDRVFKGRGVSVLISGRIICMFCDPKGKILSGWRESGLSNVRRKKVKESVKPG